MYVYGQLKSAQLETSAVDLATAPLGRLWFNTASAQMKISDGTDAINILANDGHCVFGRSATASENVRLHKGAAGVLQFVAGDDVTVEDTLATSLSKLSFQFEGYPTASLPVAGAAGRVAWNTTTGKLNVDNGASWDAVETGNAVNILPLTLYENLVAGDLVNMMNDAGVAKIQKMDGADPLTLKAAVDFEAGDTRYISSCYDASTGKLIIAYVDNGDSDKGKVVVGTFDANNVVSFGTPVVFNNAVTSFVKIIYSAAHSKWIIAYRDGGNSNRGTLIVGETSGTSANLGSEVVFKAAATHSIQFGYSNGSFILTYGVDADTTHLYGRAGKFTATLSVTLGAETSKPCGVISANSGLYCTADNDKAFAFYIDGDYLGIVITNDPGTDTLTMSGTALIHGSPKSVVLEDTDYNKFYGFSPLGGYSELKHYTDGNAKFVGHVTVYEPLIMSGFANSISGSIDVNRKCALLVDINATANRLKIFDYKGGYYNSAFYASNITLPDSSVNTMEIIYIPSRDIFVVMFANDNAANKGTAIVGSYVTYHDVLGILQANGNAGDSKTVAVEGGISTIHSGLTIGATYYIQSNGTIGLTKSPYPIGRALSATTMLVTKRP